MHKKIPYFGFCLHFIIIVFFFLLYLFFQIIIKVDVTAHSINFFCTKTKALSSYFAFQSNIMQTKLIQEIKFVTLFVSQFNLKKLILYNSTFKIIYCPQFAFPLRLHITQSITSQPLATNYPSPFFILDIFVFTPL